MLEVQVILKEGYNNETQEFENVTITMRLEHSLHTIALWESKWKKPFMSKDRTSIELNDYIKIMSVNDNIDDETINSLSIDNMKAINDYINDDMTATTFSNNGPKTPTTNVGNKIVTAELIYYQMLSHNIPIECQHWHLNRLLTLIKVFNIKNQTDKKMSSREILNSNAELNAKRLAALKTKG